MEAPPGVYEEKGAIAADWLLHEVESPTEHNAIGLGDLTGRLAAVVRSRSIHNLK